MVHWRGALSGRHRRNLVPWRNRPTRSGIGFRYQGPLSARGPHSALPSSAAARGAPQSRPARRGARFARAPLGGAARRGSCRRGPRSRLERGAARPRRRAARPRTSPSPRCPAGRSRCSPRAASRAKSRSSGTRYRGSSGRMSTVAEPSEVVRADPRSRGAAVRDSAVITWTPDSPAGGLANSPGVRELPAEVEPAQKTECLTERHRLAGSEPGSQRKASAVAQQKLGALARSMRRREHEHAWRGARRGGGDNHGAMSAGRRDGRSNGHHGGRDRKKRSGAGRSRSFRQIHALDVDNGLWRCGIESLSLAPFARRADVNVTAIPRAGAIVREIARNLERMESGAHTNVCLCSSGKGRDTCVCYRDAGHIGRHHCPCGVEWK